MKELWPVKGMTLEKLADQGFGGAWQFGSPRDGGRRLHAGIDMYGSLGDPVFAMRPGVVSWVGQFYRGTYGVAVRPTGQPEVEDVYGEMSSDSMRVFVGDIVTEATQLGAMGDTLTGMPAMLHLEHQENGVKTDPMPLLRRLGERK